MLYSVTKIIVTDQKTSSRIIFLWRWPSLTHFLPGHPPRQLCGCYGLILGDHIIWRYAGIFSGMVIIVTKIIGAAVMSYLRRLRREDRVSLSVQAPCMRLGGVYAGGLEACLWPTLRHAEQAASEFVTRRRAFDRRTSPAVVLCAYWRREIRRDSLWLPLRPPILLLMCFWWGARFRWSRSFGVVNCLWVTLAGQQSI